MSKTFIRGALRAAVIAAVSGGVFVMGASTAAAHVTVDPSNTTAGSYAVLTFAVPHGCDGSATTEVAIKIPENVRSVTPTVNPGWTIDKKMVTLDAPVADAHGNEITQRVDQVVYTALTALPDDMRDAFELSVQLPDTPGESLTFPTIQTCEQGDANWIEIADNDEAALEHPAPAFVITAAGSGVDAGDSSATATAQAVADEGTSITNIVSWTALIISVIAVIVGVMAMLRGNKTA